MMFSPCKVYKVPLDELFKYSSGSKAELPPELLKRVDSTTGCVKSVEPKSSKKALPSWRVRIDQKTLMSPRERVEARLEGKIPKKVRLVKKAIAQMTSVTPLEEICKSVGVNPKFASNPYLSREYAKAIQRILRGVA